MSINRVGGRDLATDQQIRLLQEQVAAFQKELAVAQENLETVLKLTDAWATKLTSLHNTRFPTLRSAGGAATRKFILQ